LFLFSISIQYELFKSFVSIYEKIHFFNKKELKLMRAFQGAPTLIYKIKETFYHKSKLYSMNTRNPLDK